MCCFLLFSSGTVNSEIFARTLFSPISLNYICDVNKSRLEHDLPVSVNNRVISRGFYFHKTSYIRIFVKIKPS